MMIRQASKTIELTEYQQRWLEPDELDDEVATALWRKFRNQIDVEFPSPKTDGKWGLRPSGWVGAIPVASDLSLRLLPKVPLGNVFRMLEYAYQLPFETPEGSITSCTLEEYFESLASVLAKRVLERVRRGLYRSYLDETGDLQYVRGRLDARQLYTTPWNVSLRCRFEEHTADVLDNQILAWTLFGVGRTRLQRPDVRADVTRAYRAVAARVSLCPQLPAACVGRLYHRLNSDYEPMHALCRFFLEHRGPTHEAGDHTMVPFLVDMARLYELFVARWLEEHLPEPYRVDSQHRVRVDQGGVISFQIDLVLRDQRTGETLCVLDTKYKGHDSPETKDFNQIVAYAISQKCRYGALVYPEPNPTPFGTVFDRYYVRALTFAIDGDLQEAGQRFVGELLDWVTGGPHA